MQDLYVNDENFRGYVERYSAKHKISAAEAMTHVLVREYGRWCKQRQQEKANSTYAPVGECV